MRRFLSLTLALALVAGFFVLSVPSAVAGGPTSVLLVNYETGRSAAALNGSSAYTELQSILTEEVPVIWLTELEFPVLINKRLRNVNIDANGPNSEFDEAHLAP